MCVLAQRVL
jgi:tetratricopeptide (TPR) repeat protein